MFYICETEKQLETLEKLCIPGCYIDILPVSEDLHPLLSEPLVVYLHPVDSEEGFIVPIDHPEGQKTPFARVSSILSKSNIIYTLNKKKFISLSKQRDSIDLTLLAILNGVEIPVLTEEKTLLRWYERNYPEYKETNRLVPLSKIYEILENRYKQVKHLIFLEKPEEFPFYNDIYTKIFYYIETKGIGCTSEIVERYNLEYPEHSIRDATIYSRYNLYNITGRPSNSFNSVNFSAIPKKKEYKSLFIPKNDQIIQFDYDGYHLRLICDLIDYPLTPESAHKQLGELYHVGDLDYDKVKQTNFQIIYGTEPEEGKNLEITKRISVFVENLWKEFQKEGFIKDPISGKRLFSTLPDMNPRKLFNYYIQSLETSRNVVILYKVLKFLDNYKTELVSYNYDAFILDYCKEDGEELIDYLETIISQNQKYPVKIKTGNSFNL